MTRAVRRTRMAADKVGDGEPALLMIPGWCGPRTVFRDALAFTGAHRTTVAVDLPGHGPSLRNDDFGFDEIADDAIELVDSLGLDKIIPVATSHGGWAAIELRRRLGKDRVPGIVLLDWMVLGTPPGFTDALAALQNPDAWEQVRADLFGRWTTGVESPAIHSYVESMAAFGFDMWARAGREIAAQFATYGSPLEALTGMDTPTVHLYAQPADDSFLAAQQEFASSNPWFSVTRLDARSHFPILEAPAQTAAAIEEFARTV